MRLEVERSMPGILRALLLENLRRELPPDTPPLVTDVEEVDGLLDLAALTQLPVPDEPALRYAPFAVADPFAGASSVFAAMEQRRRAGPSSVRVIRRDCDAIRARRGRRRRRAGDQNDAMTALSAPVAGAAIEAYDFSQYRLIVDVAGGHGEVLTSILEASPGARGVLADVGHVVEGARRRIDRAGLSDRCQAVECDFFKAVPSGGDAYVMKHIIHDWDDARASTILQNIGTAMGAKRGAVILLESVIPSGPEPDLGKFIDIEMLLWPGGRERTAEEFRTLLDRSGFELTKIVPTKSPLSVIEAIRK